MSENFGDIAQSQLDETVSNITDAYGSEGLNELERTASRSGSDLLATAGQTVEGVTTAPMHFAQEAASGRVPAMLRLYGTPSVSPTSPTGVMSTVVFDFNPEKITIARSPRKETHTVHSSSNPHGSDKWAIDFPPGKLSINNIIFEGLHTKLVCDTLLDWCSPQGGMAGKLKALKSSIGSGISRELWDKQPSLLFMWGPPHAGFFYQVTLDSVNIIYERFTPQGIPIRASVNLQMTEQYNGWTSLPTNPTSGGLPGRREHIVTQGDNLQQIAMNYFGTPSAWRPIAQLNGINDPFRLRPGQRVLIPHQSELPRGGEQ